MSDSAQVPQVSANMPTKKTQFFNKLKTSFAAQAGKSGAAPTATPTNTPVDTPMNAPVDPAVDPIPAISPATLPPAETPSAIPPTSQAPAAPASTAPGMIHSLNTQLDQLQLPLQPPATGGAKELGPKVTIEKPSFDMVGGMQQVETEPNMEMPPEVEAYISQVENQPNQIPDQIVIADPASNQPITATPAAKPVIILPITPEMEKAGEHKNSSFSIRWLVEWSRKLMKEFAGQVIYRKVDSEKK
jgi:hypothetical protein